MKNVQKSFFHTSQFFWNLSTHKKIDLQRYVASENKSLEWDGKEDKVICNKVTIISKDFLDPLQNEEISKVLYVLSFGLQFEMKLVQRILISIGVKIRQTLYS